MWGAAPRRYRRLLLCAIAAMGFVGMPAAQARVDSGFKSIALPELWGLEVGRGNLHILNDQAAQQALHANVNTLLVDNAHLRKRQRQRVARLAKRFGFRTIAVPHAATRSLRGGRAKCARAPNVVTREGSARFAPPRSAAPVSWPPCTRSTWSSCA